MSPVLLNCLLSRRYWIKSVAKLFRSGRADFLAAVEAFDVSGLGGPRQPRPIHSAVLPFVLRRCLRPRLGVRLTFARILSRRYFRVTADTWTTLVFVAKGPVADLS